MTTTNIITLQLKTEYLPVFFFKKFVVPVRNDSCIVDTFTNIEKTRTQKGKPEV